MLEDAPDAVIHALHHCGVDGVGLLTALARDLRILGDGVRLRLQWRVDRVVREVEEERLVLVCRDDFLGLSGEAVSQVFAVGRLLEATHESLLAVLALAAERREVTHRRAGVVARDVDVEALLLRLEALAAQVPLAHVRGDVTGGLEAFSKGNFFERELLVNDGPRKALVGPVSAAGEPIGEVQAGRILAGHNARARGRAHGARRVGVGELHALRRHTVEMRRAVKLAAITAEVALPEVINEEEDEVGLRRGSGGELQQERSGKRASEAEERKAFHEAMLPKLARNSSPRSVRCSPSTQRTQRGATFETSSRRFFLCALCVSASLREVPLPTRADESVSSRPPAATLLPCKQRST